MAIKELIKKAQKQKAIKLQELAKATNLAASKNKLKKVWFPI